MKSPQIMPDRLSSSARSIYSTTPIGGGPPHHDFPRSRRINQVRANDSYVERWPAVVGWDGIHTRWRSPVQLLNQRLNPGPFTGPVSSLVQKPPRPFIAFVAWRCRYPSIYLTRASLTQLALAECGCTSLLRGCLSPTSPAMPIPAGCARPPSLRIAPGRHRARLRSPSLHPRAPARHRCSPLPQC